MRHRQFLPILPTLLGLLILLLPAVSSAGLLKLTGQNIQLSATAGYLGFKQFDTGERPWSGIDLAPAATLSIHPSFAIAANFAHGIPLERGDGHINIARLSGQLRLFPPIGQIPGPDGLFLLGGPMWMGENSLREWSGLNSQITASHFFGDKVFAVLVYAHGFAWDPAAGDRDFLRAGFGIGSPLAR